MPTLKTIRLIFTFYKGFLLASIIITSCCGVIFWEYGLSVFRALFWLKISTLAISFYFINTYKAREYYYYHNLHLSKILLWCSILITDFLLFIFLIVLLHKLQ